MSDPKQMKTLYSAEPESLFAYLRKVWKYRSMILLLAKRDLSIKYAQTLLGLVWTIIQPLTGLLIFTFFFSMVIELPGIPESGYAIFAFTGMTGWYFFSFIVSQSSTSVLTGQELTKKIFFPNIILPLSKVLVGLVDLGISMALLAILMLVKGIYPGWQIILLPLFVLANILVGLSVGLWLCALTVRYRDLQHIVPYMVNFGIWLTPVFFPATLMPEQFRGLMYLNPMAGVVEGLRWCIWGHTDFDIRYLIGIIISLFILFLGVLYFKRTEDRMIDII